MNDENQKYSTTKLLITEKTDNKTILLSANKYRKAEGGLRTRGYYKKSYKGKPLISIVTVVYNGEKFLEEAIESVINQNYDNIEYIIIDGCSTDNTIDIIKKYDDQIDYWVSEPDHGQSDAFIKAFSICHGKWISWLNGDDILLPGAIKELVQTAKLHPDIDCFTGNVIWTTANNEVIQCRIGEKWIDILPKLGILNVYGPTTFFKKSIYNSVEGININLFYKMDTDLWWQFFEAGAKFKRLQSYIWTLRLHPNAKMSAHHFDTSEQFDSSHPSWAEKKMEDSNIQKKYFVTNSNFKKILATIILYVYRISSLGYLKSFKDTIVFKGRNINKLIKDI